MKKILLLLVGIVAITAGASAMSPAGSYDEELAGRNGSFTAIKPQVEVNVGYVTGGKLNTNNFSSFFK